MNIWMWLAWMAIGVGLGAVQWLLLKRIITLTNHLRKSAVALIAKIALWAAALAGALLVDVRAPVAIVAGVTLAYGFLLVRLWLNRGE